jgi:hypothetical protein
VAQWVDLHGLSLTDAHQETVTGAVRLNWGDQMELYTLPILGHGTPIDSSDVGRPAPFVLEAGISSSRRIARFWDLAPAAAVQKPTPEPPTPQPSALPKIEALLSARTTASAGREGVILRALKAAGLIRKA